MFIVSSIKLGISKNEILTYIQRENFIYNDLVEIIFNKIKNQLNEKIFVSIPCYKDPESLETIKDMFKKAEKPENLRVYCLYQGDFKDEIFLKLKALEKDFNKKLFIGFIDKSRSEGVCWARSNILKNISDESYFLQIDSHTRFIDNWDSKLKDDYIRAPSKKCLMSGHPSPYRIDKTNRYNEHTYLDIINSKKINTRKDSMFGESNIFASDAVLISPNENTYGNFIKHYFISAGYLFGPTEFFKQVPYDPYILFNGEEIDLSIRAFSFGWDIYVPIDNYIWHLYNTEAEDKEFYWDELYEKAVVRDAIAKERLEFKFKMTENIEYEKSIFEIENYGLGDERSLAEWEERVGIDLKNKKFR